MDFIEDSSMVTLISPSYTMCICTECMSAKLKCIKACALYILKYETVDNSICTISCIPV